MGKTMRVKAEVTVDQVREAFDYDPESGWLIWKKKTGPNARVGHRAGFVNSRYRKVRLHGADYFEHRIIWLHVHGEWPADCIDHVNRDCFDNRLVNLRNASFSLNQANAKMRSDNSTGFKGVYYLKDCNQFVAQVRKKRIGVFESAEAAYAAYCRAAKEEFGQFARLA